MINHGKANAKAVPWNKGRAVGQKAPFTAEQARLIRAILEADGNRRDLALYETALDTMLRASDLLALRVGDVTDHAGQVVAEFAVRQQKTGRATVVGLTERSRRALAGWIAASGKPPAAYLFTATGAHDRPLSRMQLGRLVKRWAGHARLDPRRFATHSLRRTKAALVFEATLNVELVRELLGQRSVAATSAYLNLGQRRALEIARQIEI